jgi:FSR family fosmidomycin resistance protein-like MFS transporter
VITALFRLINLALVFFLIEFFDEFHYGLQSAALPSMRTDLTLTYAQVGLLLGLPKIINTFIEPLIMLLGDSALRKRLVVGGGLMIVLCLLLIGSATSFFPLLIAFIITYPASGAFVSLSQATLMDLNPGREPHSMARWTVYGSLGALLGPALLAGAFAIGLGWRLPYLGLAALALGLVMIFMETTIPTPSRIRGQSHSRLA